MFDVEWSQFAENQLAAIWTYLKTGALANSVDVAAPGLRSREIDAVNSSLAALDRMLASPAAPSIGKAFQGLSNRRIFGLGCMTVGFDIDLDRKQVTVLVASYFPNRQ